jgi:hypothetical protein
MMAPIAVVRTSRLYRVLLALVAPGLVYYAAVALAVISSPLPGGADLASSPIVDWLQTFLFLPLTMLVGFLIVRRVPGNVIGPMLILIGASLAGGAQTLEKSALLQAAAQFFNQSNIALFSLLLFYFPSGRPNLPRLQRVMLAWAIAAPAYAAFNLLATSHLNPDTINSANPLFIAQLAPFAASANRAFPLFFIPLFLGLFGLIRRYRAAQPRERQQIKWFVWNMSTIVLIFAGWLVASFTPVGFDSLFGKVLLLVSSTWFYAIIPLGVGIAILRHNLYDIDIIIRKTLVYSLLTSSLAVVYFGSVVLAQQLFRAAAGETPDIAIVISTLLMAALFSPLRRRIQEGIDRRFYRRKYDAEQTLARFNQTLRDEVDIEALKAQLIGVVQETMQPVTIALGVQMGAMKGIDRGNTEST